MRDDIVDEVRKIREAYAERFDFDLEAIFKDIKERERTSGRTYVRFAPKRIPPMVHEPPVDPIEIPLESEPSQSTSQEPDHIPV